MVVDSAAILAAHKAFPKGSSLGASRLQAQHLIDAISGTISLVSRSQPVPFSIFGRRGGSGAVALMSSCCRLYNKRSTKDRMCLALSGYLSLMQTGWNFLLFVFLGIVLSCEQRSHVSANV